jgi:endonuclease/exonuclease/phosphatase family metal-dependent hydrolase
MKIVSWNIQACRVRSVESDPTDATSYSETNIDYIAEILQKYLPDVVLLQEVHANSTLNQAKEIAKLLGHKYVVTDTIDEVSYMDSNYGLCQAILSKNKLNGHTYQPLENPQYEVTKDDGRHYVSRDSSMSKASINLGKNEIDIITTHFLPFGSFNINPFSDAAKPIKESLLAYTRTLGDTWIMAGDFNINTSHLRNFVPALFSVPNHVSSPEINEDTAAWGMTLDHVIFSGVRLMELLIDSSTLTDHYPVVIEIDLS